ncbi:tetratricopeptide repeat-containing sensor histidine kinase [Flectobacillus roseus]
MIKTFPFLSKISLLLIATGLLSYFEANAKVLTLPQADSLKRVLKGKVTPANLAKTQLLLSEHFLLRDGELKSDLDSASTLAEEATRVSVVNNLHQEYVKSLYLRGSILLEKGFRAEGRGMFRKALGFAKLYNLPEEKGDYFEKEGHLIEQDEQHIKQKIQFYQKAILYFAQANAYEKEAPARQMLGDLLIIDNQKEQALKELHSALIAFRKAKIPDTQGVYKLMANVYIQMGKYDNALENSISAVKIAESLKDSSLQMSSIYNTTALVYYYLKQEKPAVAYWEKALVLAKKYQERSYIQMISGNIITAKARINDYKGALKDLIFFEKKYAKDLSDEMIGRIPYLYLNIYIGLREFDKAQPHYQKVWEIFSKLSPEQAYYKFYLNSITRYLIETHQYKKAYPLLLDYEKIAIQEKNYLYLSLAYQNIYKADSALGRLQDAVKHLKLYKVASDSLLNIEKAKQLINLQVKFETEQKDKNIQILQQKTEIQNSIIQNERVLKVNIIVGAVILLLLLVISVSRYRLKQKVNLQLEKKQAEINKQNDLLKKLLNEKEWLLREIHHRVKNNLQVVISLLNAQSAHLNNQDAIVAIQKSQQRMQAISLIHQKLYQTDGLSTIDMRWYIAELISYVKEYSNFKQNITIDYVLEDVILDVSQAVPVGLILNEVINNAIKYAFPHQSNGVIRICLQLDDQNFVHLGVRDNGIGLPDDFLQHTSESLGVNLIYGLAEQIDGNVEIISDNGVKVQIVFPLHKELVNV